MATLTALRKPNVIPGKAIKAPAPVPGIARPAVVSAAVKVATAKATGTPVPPIATRLRYGGTLGPVRVKLAPRLQAPPAPGGMPRKLWVNPQAAVPITTPRGPQSHVRGLGRGRAEQRGTR